MINIVNKQNHQFITCSRNTQTMFKSSRSQIYKKIPPPPSLNPEHARIWAGWNELGNKEVAREASAKGFYVNLAVTFVAARKGIEFAEAEKWFQDEVIKWFKELLARKQIHRATHILNNLRLDAFRELTNIFCETEDKELREYIGDHLLKGGIMDSSLKNCWILLKGIESDENLSTSLTEQQCGLNINKILKLDCDSKSNVAVALFFTNYDLQLEPFLNAECLWSFLLMSNKIELVKLWIKVQYSEKQLDCSDISYRADILDGILKLFRKYSITNAIVNSIFEKYAHVPFETKNIILNELSKYGVFNDKDTTHALHLLHRLHNTGNVIKYKQILELDTASASVQTFHGLLIDHCLNCNLFGVINLCLLYDKGVDVLLLLKEKSNELFHLISSIYEAVENINDCKTLQINLLKVSQYLNCDVVSYFKNHPIILVLLILFDNNLKFSDSLQSGKETFTVENIEIHLDSLFSSFTVLRAIVNKFQKQIVIHCATLMQLLANNSNLNIDCVTEFTHSIGSVPHFNCHKLVEQYGYKKTMNCVYFVNQCQPSKACRMLLMNSNQESDKCKLYLKTENIAIKDCLDDSLAAGAVAFLEMLGESSKRLRVHLEAMNLIFETSASNDTDEIVAQFLQVNSDPKIVADILETTVMKTIQSLDVRKNLIDIIKKYEIMIKFCTLHGLSLPEQLLHLFAVNNLWLPFLIYAQIHSYPLQQIRKLVQNFKNPNLLEHVNHSVLHNIDLDTFMGKRNTRTSLYAKLGVHHSHKKATANEETMHTSTSSLSSHESVSSCSSESLDPSDADVLDMKATLLQTLIRCHNSADPPKAFLQAAQLYRNPLLAVLATSYEPDSVVTNWLVWLGVSCDMYDSVYDYDSMSLCPQSVMDFLKKVVQHNYIRTLKESFEVFLPENPLRQFLTFLNECARFNFDSDVSKENIAAFHRSLECIRSNSIVSETDYEVTYLNNKLWIQKTALVLAVSVLEYCFTSRVDQIRFVNILCASDEEGILDFSRLFANVLIVLESLRKLNCKVQLNFSGIYNAEAYKNMIHNYLNVLINNKKFDEALVIAEMEKIPKDNILIEQFRSAALKRADETFWRNCSETFHKYNCAPENVIDFYLEFSQKVENASYERYFILKLALEWAAQSSNVDINEIETRLWISYINLDVQDKNRAFEITTLCKRPYGEMKMEIERVKGVANSYTDIDNFAENLRHSISVLLNYGRFWDALKIAKLFAAKHDDLEILKLCSSIAEGLLQPSQFNKEQRLLIGGGSAYVLRSKSHWPSKISSISSDCSAGSSVCTAHEVDPIDQLSKDNLIALERLVERLKSGSAIGRNIFMMYRISVNIEIPYVVLLENDDDAKLLKDALDDNCRNKLEVVHDFITVYKWSRPRITDFLCEELINTINAYIKSKDANLLMWDLILDNDFPSILQLLQENCSLLGMKLFTYSNALHMSQSLQAGEFKISEIALIVELLIRAHDCFTADCNMEGITIILKKCQTVIALLLKLQSWKLIVRLLTGIRRYTEMEYAFQNLRENDQFEFLLSKGSKRDNSLKLALLAYLKKYCPDNRELYRIVALHFTLFSEVAHLWELEADGVIGNLISISKLEMENNSINPALEPFIILTGTDGTKVCLHKAMTNYSHAAQYHLQGEKLSKAMNSAKQAELIALQMSTLKYSSNGTAICLLHLNPLQINALLTKHLSFPQALIVIEAYNHKPDWASILHEQCVVSGRMDYLEKFQNHFLLSDHIVHDISRKFFKIIPNANNIRCMKEILTRLSSVHVKYKVASELGFSDIVEDLLLEEKLAYLKDTVWKKGYRN